MVSRRHSVGVRRPGPAGRHQADIDQSIKAVVDGDIRSIRQFKTYTAPEYVWAKVSLVGDGSRGAHSVKSTLTRP